MSQLNHGSSLKSTRFWCRQISQKKLKKLNMFLVDLISKKCENVCVTDNLLKMLQSLFFDENYLFSITLVLVSSLFWSKTPVGNPIHFFWRKRKLFDNFFFSPPTQELYTHKAAFFLQKTYAKKWKKPTSSLRNMRVKKRKKCERNLWYKITLENVVFCMRKFLLRGKSSGGMF